LAGNIFDRRHNTKYKDNKDNNTKYYYYTKHMDTKNKDTMHYDNKQTILIMRLCHPPDGSTSPKYKLLFFIRTKKKFAKRRTH
jgi:hypothetical protein